MKIHELFLQPFAPVVERQIRFFDFLPKHAWVNLKNVVAIIVLIGVSHLKGEDRKHEKFFLGIPFEVIHLI